MLFIYDVCVHDECDYEGDYREESGVEFSNPVHVWDFIKTAAEDTEYEVFQVVHYGFGGKSELHVRPLSAYKLSAL